MPAKAKDLIEAASKAIKSGNQILAVAKIRESVSIHGTDATVSEIRRSGCFRCSNYEYQTQTLRPVVENCRSDFPNGHHQKYLCSVLALIWLSQTAYGVIRDARRHFDRDDVKTYLVSLDFLFLGHTPRPLDDQAFNGHSKEGLCSAFSYLFWLMSRTKTLNSSDLNRLNYRGIGSNLVYETLATVASVLQLRNAELLVDHYDYVAERRGNTCFVEAQNADFEKSVRLGYILLETQQFVVATEEPEWKEAISVLDFGERFAKELDKKLVRVIEKPVRRLRVELPLKEDFLKLFGDGAAFAEDLTLRRGIQKELLLDPTLYKKPVIDGVSASDLAAVQRLFLFMTSVLYSYCKERGILFGELHATSQLRLFPYQDILKLLTEVFDADRASAILKILTWLPSSAGYFDLQYQPFIPAGEFIATPTAICGLSSLARNQLVKHRIRYDSESKDDPVGDRLAFAVQERFSQVHRDIDYKWTKNGEIDMILIGEKCLFAFECKNTIHPSSPFELRGAFQQLNEAVEQLDQLKSFYPDPAFREQLRADLGVADPLPPVLHVCTITGVRTFAGLRWRGVPTRPLWEMCNFFSSGIVTLNTANEDGNVESIEFRLWQGESFTEADLVEALGAESFWEIRLTAMEQVEYTYSLRGKKLKLVTYAKNLATLIELMAERYTVVGIKTPKPAGEDLEVSEGE